MYKSVIIGSGGRAAEHAQAYQHISRAGITAAASIDPDSLQKMADKYNIKKTYNDFQEMIAAEKPDLVHAVTPPSVRLAVLECADKHGVKAVILEKPVAVDFSDYTAIKKFSSASGLKIIINHQLEFHKQRMRLQKQVSDNSIGKIRFIDASARMNMSGQGTHMLQAICSFMKNSRPISVFAQAGGIKGLEKTPLMHMAPDNLQAVISFENGASALLRTGDISPFVKPAEPFYMHKRIEVFGEAGRAEWNMFFSDICCKGKCRKKEHDYRTEDLPAQARMINAMFDWMENDDKIHPLNINRALAEFEILLAAYISVIKKQPVSFPLVYSGESIINNLRKSL